MTDEDLTDEERAEQVRGVLFKALAVLAVIGVLIFIGTTIMVRALGLNESGDTGPVGAAPEKPTKPLPTTALPSPEDEKSEEPSEPAKPAKAGKPGRLELAVSPVLARPMERVNLTGTYKGEDNIQLEVQRFEDGEWRDFGVQATVRVGTYETYIMTGRTGENRFRMFDPESDTGSNVILVTID